jgi:hypothetical protein
LSAFSRRDARDDIGAIIHALARVECARTASDALHDKARVFIDKNGHDRMTNNESMTKLRAA